MSNLEPNNKVEHAIARECRALQDLLVSKNRQYGNSALDPLRCFTKASAIEQILVRIDDKLNRISRGGESFDGEDTEKDLAGYLILLRVARSGVEADTPVGHDVDAFELVRSDKSSSVWRVIKSGAQVTVERNGDYQWDVGTAHNDRFLIYGGEISTKLRDLAWPEVEPQIQYESGCGVHFKLLSVDRERAAWRCVVSGAHGYIKKRDKTWHWLSSGLSTPADNKATGRETTRADLVAASWPE